MGNNQEQIHKLITSVYSKWLSETYGISSTPLRLDKCELTSYYLRFKLIQKDYEPTIDI